MSNLTSQCAKCISPLLEVLLWNLENLSRSTCNKYMYISFRKTLCSSLCCKRFLNILKPIQYLSKRTRTCRFVCLRGPLGYWMSTKVTKVLKSFSRKKINDDSNYTLRGWRGFCGLYKTGGKLWESVFDDILLNKNDLLLLLKKKNQKKCGEI